MTKTHCWCTQYIEFQPDFFKHRWKAMSPLARPMSIVVYTVLSWRLLVCWGLVVCSESCSEQLPDFSLSSKYFSSLSILGEPFQCRCREELGAVAVPGRLSVTRCKSLGEAGGCWGGLQSQCLCRARLYSLRSKAPSLSLCRFVGQGHTWGSAQQLPLILEQKKEHSTLGESQPVAACWWRTVCHHSSLPIKARRGQCYQSLPIQSFFVGTLLFYHFDLLPTEDKRHHGRDSWMTTVIYRPRTFWTFFPLWFMNHFSIFEKQFINRSAPAEINNNEFIYIKGLILPVADNVWSQNLVGKQDFCWQCRK